MEQNKIMIGVLEDVLKLLKNVREEVIVKERELVDKIESKDMGKALLEIYTLTIKQVIEKNIKELEDSA